MERLEVAKLNHRFGFTEILKNINFTLQKGEVRKATRRCDYNRSGYL